jgi:hypothetical protein
MRRKEADQDKQRPDQLRRTDIRDLTQQQMPRDEGRQSLPRQGSLEPFPATFIRAPATA